MTRLLAYGDSLTWGSDPATGGRHAKSHRWPDVLAEALPGVEMVTDGLRGRTTAFDGLVSPADMNGAKWLPTVLHVHAPLDGVMIMLGSNDIWCGHSLRQVRRGLVRLVEIIRSHPWRLPDAPTPWIVLMAPPEMVPCNGEDGVVDQPLVALSQALTPLIQKLAHELDVTFFEAAPIAKASPLDGVHLSADDTRAIGTAMVDTVQPLL